MFEMKDADLSDFCISFHLRKGFLRQVSDEVIDKV